MNGSFLILMWIVLLPFLSGQAYSSKDLQLPENPLNRLVKNGEQFYAQGDSRGGTDPAVEAYEKEKLAKMRQNIGRRFIAIRTARPTEFFAFPDDLKKKLRINKEKEGFIVIEVVQNDLENMNFYQVKFDSGQIGYLRADAKYL